MSRREDCWWLEGVLRAKFVSSSCERRTLDIAARNGLCNWCLPVDKNVSLWDGNNDEKMFLSTTTTIRTFE